MTPTAIQQAASVITERILTVHGVEHQTIVLKSAGGDTTRTKEELIDTIAYLMAQFVPPEPESELHRIAAAPKPTFLKVSLGVSSDREFQLLHAAINLMIAFKDLDVPARNRVLTYLYSRYFTP